MNNERITTNFGNPVESNDSSKTITANGPVLLEDVSLIEKLAHFNRERIPERVVHAKGTGAFGVFTCCEDMSCFTKAKFLNQINKQTNVFVRFSTVIGSKGSAETVRDPRGFAVRFYTEDGLYDIVGNNLPIFFINDAIKFPDVIHALKPDPKNNLKKQCRFWDFASLTKESTHMITWLYTDRGIVKDFSRMDGFGVNTFIWENEEGKQCYIKYHFKTTRGIETVTRHEGNILAGTNPNIASEKLYNMIENQDYPVYDVCVQILNENDIKEIDFDPFDDTLVWDEKKFPLMKIGVLTLNRNPKNFFSEVEQAAFSPGNIVPGVKLSADKMLQGRSFAYHDAHRYRLGANYHELPINSSISVVNNNQTDGKMQMKIPSSSINYDPSNYKCATTLGTETAGYANGYVTFAKHDVETQFKQAKEHYEGLSDIEKEHLCDNIAFELHRCSEEIINKQLENFACACTPYAKKVLDYINYYKNKQ